MLHIQTGAGAPTGTPTSLGQHYIDTTNGKAYVSTGIASSADWKLTNTPTSYVSAFNSRTGNVVPQSGDYTAALVGADPSGTATSEVASHVALSNPHTQYVLSSHIGAANGVCPLDGTSKIASSYLPSYVDDVLEYANLAAFPVTGESGKLYIAIDTNQQYRWSGSTYVQIVG